MPLSNAIRDFFGVGLATHGSGFILPLVVLMFLGFGLGLFCLSVHYLIRESWQHRYR